MLVGAGAVGGRAVRQLAETEGVERVLVADRSATRAQAVQHAVGDRVAVIEWSPAQPIPSGVAVVASALPAGHDRAVAERALDAGVPFACATDDTVTARRLLDLDDAAAEAGVAIAVGCGLAPGVADVLARHAADALDTVDEVSVARFGAAGPACVLQLHASSTGDASEWRDGTWTTCKAGSGRQLVWFPDPVGSADCFRIASAQPVLLVDALPTITRASCRTAARRRDRLGAWLPAARRPTGEGGYGAVWVEVRGRRGVAREVVVYGVVDRMAIAAGTVLAVTTAALAGAPGLSVQVTATGAHGLAALVEPVPFLAELARRGVRVAVYEGTAAA
jgi:hypothetical protein